MNKIEKKKVYLKEGEVIRYIWKSDKFGRAEFDICPFFKDGKLKKIRFYPRQQITDVLFYEYKCRGQTNFVLNSWTHEGFENPWAWKYFFCKEHKQLEMSVYVPPNTDCIKVDQLSDIRILFEKEKP